MAEIDVGGAILEVPDEANDEQIQTIITNFRNSSDFDKLIDKKAGTPSRVRLLVGSAPERDKLPNLKQFYPDAVPYGNDNFVFTNPETGQPTLYNPEGLDFGDVPAVAREAAQAVGAGLGAVAGGVTGLAGGAAAPVTVPLATATGAGLGSVTAGTLFDIAVNNMAGRIDTRNFGELTVDQALDFGAAAIGQRGGELFGEGVKRVMGGARNAVQDLVDAYRRLGIDAPAGAVSGSKSLQTIEKALETSPASADIMQKRAEQILSQTKDAADNLANQFGRVQTKQGAGQSIKEAARAAAERFGFQQERIYEEAFDLVGRDTPVSVDSVTMLRVQMEQELSRASQSLSKSLEPAINTLKALEADAKAGGGIPFDALRQVRTNIGRDLDAPMLAGATSSQNTAMKRIYGALTEDMSAAAQRAGPDAAKKLATADRYTRMFMNTSAKTLEKIDKFEADDRAFEFALTSARDGGGALARLRRNFTPEEWDTVAGTVLGRMGLARPGAQDAAGEVFSVNTFLTNWNRLSPEAKKALFGGKRYADLAPALDDLTKVVGSLKEVEKLTNTSNTARTMGTIMTIQTLAGGLGGLAIGGEDAGSVGTGILATIVAPRIAAKLITNPSFVKWLTTPVTSPTGVSAHLGKLVAIGEAEPQIREEIEQYVQALRSIPSPTAKPSAGTAPE